MKPAEVLSQYRNKRLTIIRESDSNYIRLMLINGTPAKETYLGKIPMWLLNQIPMGVACIEVKEKAMVVPVNADEQDTITQLQSQSETQKSNSKVSGDIALGILLSTVATATAKSKFLTSAKRG